VAEFSEQFDGLAHPRPKGGWRGVPRPPDSLSDHPDHGPVGSLSAVARELGLDPAALANQRRRRGDAFPKPVAGHVFALDHVAEFRKASQNDDEPDGDEDDG